MDQGFRRGFTPAEKTELWDRWQRGESLKTIGRAFGKPSSSIYFQVSPYGGIRPAPRRRSRLALTLSEREEISRGIAVHRSARSMAGLLGRSPSTVSREISRNGGYDGYRACRPGGVQRGFFPPRCRKRSLVRRGRRSGGPRDHRCVPCETSRGLTLCRSGTSRSRCRLLKMRLEARPRRPALDRHIDIGRIDVQPAEAPPGPLGCHERRSGAQKKVKHRRMQGKSRLLSRFNRLFCGITGKCLDDRVSDLNRRRISNG
jgi:hypothetical protein